MACQQNVEFFLVFAEVAPVLFVQPARVSAGPRDRLPMSRGVFRANAEHAITAPRKAAIASSVETSSETTQRQNSPPSNPALKKTNQTVEQVLFGFIKMTAIGFPRDAADNWKSRSPQFGFAGFPRL
jgi:hypothetical protein